MSQTPPPAPGQKGYWRWLYTQMQAAMGDGAFMRFNGYSVPGRSFQYRSLADFQKLLNWVEGKADIEDGVAPYRGRIYAGCGGRASRGGRR
jgi:hypothetical protein